MQPWRAYLDTWSAARMRDGIGISFTVSPGEAPATARLLAASGFRRARLELGWNTSSFDNPSTISPAHESSIRTRLIALRDNGIRPLILLNSNEHEPTPTKVFPLTIVAPAPAGARSVTLGAANRSNIVPGRTGFDFDGMGAGVLITAVNGSVATLSRPLPGTLTTGSHDARTLLAEPFADPLLSNGAPNPRFERTLAAWLQYVKTTTNYVKSVLGTDDFDVEIWNEVTFGARFLWNTAYYETPPESGTGDVKDALLRRTVAFLRDPANGVPRLRIGDGFANQTQLTAGSTEPVGVTAMDKHPYNDGATYPTGLRYGGIKPIDGLGNPNYVVLGTDYRDTFVPTYVEYMPEHFLTAVQTETLIRDLAPVTTLGWKNTPHGRFTAPPGGQPPAMWITEYNLNATTNDFNVRPPMTPDERDHLRAKVALRTYAAYLGKGAAQVDLFAAKSSDSFQLIAQRFFDAIKQRPTAYPSVDPGPVMSSVGRLAAAMAGPVALTLPRSLTLDGVADNHNQVIFQGNGTPAYPPLYHRDMLFFSPFQADNHKFVAPVYVMTTDLKKVYAPGAPAGTPGRMDLPDGAFRLTVGGLDGAKAAVSYSDPITGAAKPATIVTRTATGITVQLPVTDYPRLLTIVDGEDAPPVVSKPPVRRRPKPTVKFKRAPWRVVLKKGFLVTVRCPKRCALAVMVTPQKRPKRKLTAIRRKTVARGKTATFRLPLTRSGRRWLRAHRRASLRISVAARYADKTRVAVSKSVRLR
jgi:hypothetical protein